MKIKLLKLGFIIVLLVFNSKSSFSQTKNDDELFNFYVKKLNKYFVEKKEDSISYYFDKLKPYSVDKKYYKEYLKMLVLYSHFYDGKGSFEESIKISQLGIDIAERFKDYHFMSEIYVDISHSFRLFEDYEKAFLYGKKAVDIIPSTKSKENLITKANALNVIAAAHTENNNPDSALVYQKQILDFIPTLDSTEIKNTFVNIGYAYMELGYLPEAKKYTEIGLRLYRPTKSDYALSSIFTNLAMYGRRAKEYNYALQMFDSAIYYGKKSKYIETFEWIYDERAMVYKSLNNYKKATEDLDKLIVIKDSMFKKERDKNAQEIEAIYKTAKNEKEILQQREELLAQKLSIKNRNLYAIIITSILLIVGIIFFAIYKKNQFKRKQLQKEIDLKDALATIKTQNRLQEQRLKISRDLHDNIGSQLTFIISSIDNLKYVSKDANETIKEKLATISSFTGDTIHQLRDTIWAMNKSEISIEDLHARVLSFIEKAKKAVPNIVFDISYDIQKNKSLSSLVGMNIFRVIQEAINNAVKYAEASKITITFFEKGDEFHATITDNGIGFDFNKVDLGNGLSNMEKRMSEIGGKVNITSNPTKGTEIHLKTNIKDSLNIN